MEKPTQHSNALHLTEIARLARRLWQQAGWPSGRYIEFWTKVEQAIAVTGNGRAGQLMTSAPPAKAASPALSGLAAPDRLIATTVWKQTKWKHRIIRKKNGGQTTTAAVRRVPTHHR